MKTAIEMAREAGAIHIHERPKEFAIVGNEAITRFAELVREQAIAEANAKANASWTLMCEKMVAIEREACANSMAKIVMIPTYTHGALVKLSDVVNAIRARGQA